MMDRDSHFLEVLRACRHPDLRRRLNALEELEKVYLDHVKAVFLLVLLGKTSIYQEQSAILGIMSLIGPRAPVEELTHILLDRDEAPGSLREAVAGTLAALEENAPVDVLIDILQDPTEEAGLREEIAGLLGTFGERVPLEVLVAAAADAEPGVRAAGIASLSAQGPRAPLEPITAALGHAEWYVRMEAVKALGRARERAPIDLIVAALGDTNPRVREAAAEAIDLLLEWFGPRVPLAPLVAALLDEDANVRESCLYALANHPEYAPVELIAEALDDQNPYIRCAALRVLERMDKRVPEALYPKILEMAAMDPYPNARKYANRTMLILKGFSLGHAHDYPGEEFTGE